MPNLYLSFADASSSETEPALVFVETLARVIYQSVNFWNPACVIAVCLFLRKPFAQDIRAGPFSLLRSKANKMPDLLPPSAVSGGGGLIFPELLAHANKEGMKFFMKSLVYIWFSQLKKCSL